MRTVPTKKTSFTGFPTDIETGKIVTNKAQERCGKGTGKSQEKHRKSIRMSTQMSIEKDRPMQAAGLFLCESFSLTKFKGVGTG